MKKPYINVLKELPYIQNDHSSGFDPGGTAANAASGELIGLTLYH